jgi:hypothetical protein
VAIFFRFNFYKMLGKSVNWIPLIFLLAPAWLHCTTKPVRSQEEPRINSQSTFENLPALDFSKENNQVFPDEELSNFHLTQAEVNPTTNPGGQNLRRKPSQNEQEFEPESLPLIVPGLEEIQEEPLPTPYVPYKASPNISIVTPSGYGADWGKIGIGVGYQERTRFTDTGDGVIGFGFGLGDAQNLVGLQVGLTLVDVSDPFNDGSISFKLHRRLPFDMSVAVGVQGGFTFGVTDGGSSVYGVLTKRFALNQDLREPFSEIYTSIGVGGGQFRSEADVQNGNETVGVFGSVAVRLAEPISLITEWTGQDLTVGISFVPFRNIPFVIVPAFTDVTNSAGNGGRFILGAGYSFSF